MWRCVVSYQHLLLCLTQGVVEFMSSSFKDFMKGLRAETKFCKPFR